jgi:tRNA U34 5-methylaminomethyl-2-thiouridine-forming methyltransferase MnmC
MEYRRAAREALEVRITADGSRTLFDARAGQTYHSDRGAWAETRHVFLEGSGVAERLRPGTTVRIVEVGLGTGANLLASWDAARAAGARLHYRALERTPPPAAVVAALGLEERLADRSLVPAWLEVLADLARQRAPAWRAYRPADDLTLEVALGDAAAGAGGAPAGPAARALQPDWADAIYHDAFSREASPTLWSEVFLRACARALAPGGAWVSYSVAGEVRRRLRAAGLDPAKRPGPPGGKREMTRAVRPT